MLGIIRLKTHCDSRRLRDGETKAFLLDVTRFGYKFINFHLARESVFGCTLKASASRKGSKNIPDFRMMSSMCKHTLIDREYLL